jgi:Spy/CpxP family protein refolding chaperone
VRGGAVVLTAVVVVALSAPWAAGQQLGVPQGRWWERPRVAAELALSDEQKTKLEAATLAGARAMIDLKATVERAELDLKVAAEKEPFAPDAVRAAFRTLQQGRQRLEGERLEMLIKVREALTAEQWRKLQELKRDRLRERPGGAEGTPPLRPVRPRWPS